MSDTPRTDACTGDCRCHSVSADDSADVCPRSEMLLLEHKLTDCLIFLKEIRAGYGGQQVSETCTCDDCAFLTKLDALIAKCTGKEPQ